MRILLASRSYPAPGDLYQYPFVHRRVLAYLRAGHDVRVFRPTSGEPTRSHVFEGVECLSGGPDALLELVRSFAPDVAAIHGLSEQMWAVLQPVVADLPIRAWLHGSEIPAFFRAKASCIADHEERSRAFAAVNERTRFWRSLLPSPPARFGLVFVSHAALGMMREDLAGELAGINLAVIPNPIDTSLFAYAPKTADSRWRVLTIRPFDSKTYGNDMAVEVIRRLHDQAPRLSFTLIGEGPLFAETVAPLTGLERVRTDRRFLSQSEIAGEHRRHGIFLVPTRLDTQGVSRDEAMASGLVPVTNAIPAVQEFVDGDCAGLAPPEDADGLAAALLGMLDDPQLFLARSAAAAERIRRDRSEDRIIPAELALLQAAVAG